MVVSAEMAARPRQQLQPEMEELIKQLDFTYMDLPELIAEGESHPRLQLHLCKHEAPYQAGCFGQYSLFLYPVAELHPASKELLVLL